MKRHFGMILAFLLALPVAAQTIQIPAGFTASASGAVTFPFGCNPVVPCPQTFLYFPSTIVTLGANITAVGTTTSWTAQIEQASASTGPWTNCGSAITITASSTGSGTCTPSGSSYVELVITAGSGGGSLNGLVYGPSLSSVYLPLAGGTMTGAVSAPSVTDTGVLTVAGQSTLTSGGNGAVVSTSPGNSASFFNQAATSVWAREGVVISPASGDNSAVEEPTVISDTTCTVIAASSCLRMYFTCGSGENICLAESSATLPLAATWTRASTPLSGVTGRGSFLIKNSGTYYLFTIQGTATTMYLYTSSDGQTFTLNNSNILPVSTETSYGNLAVIPDNNGTTFDMVYEAVWPAAAGWSAGIATATSLSGTWTKGGSNPVIAIGGQGPMLWEDGSNNYWLWGHCCGGLPSDGVRYKASSFTGTWARNPAQMTLPRLTADEGVGLNGGQVADQSLVAWNGNVLDFYTASPNGSSIFNIKMALASGYTFTTLTASSESPVFTGTLKIGNNGAASPPLSFSTDGTNSFISSSNALTLQPATGTGYVYIKSLAASANTNFVIQAGDGTTSDAFTAPGGGGIMQEAPSVNFLLYNASHSIGLRAGGTQQVTIPSGGNFQLSVPLQALTTYTAAGTQLAACASGTVGEMAFVGDASLLTPGTIYLVSAGAGTVKVYVQCSYSGSTYAWQTM